MSTQPVHILVVDDDDVDAEGVQRAVKAAKILNPISRARDGIEALDMLRGTNGKEPIPRPFLILLDLNMPRMNGIEFLDVLRRDEHLHRSVVIVLTTSQAERDKLAAYDKHVAGYVSKSKAGEDFTELIDMLDHYWRIVELPTEDMG